MPDYIRMSEDIPQMIKKNPPKETKGFSCYEYRCDLFTKIGDQICDPLFGSNEKKIVMCPYCRRLNVASIEELEKGKICKKHNDMYMMPISTLPRKIENGLSVQ